MNNPTLIIVLAIATVYVAAAGFHAFKTLQVQGFQRIGEAEIAAAWKTQAPMPKLTRGTLLASRRSRDAVNAKVTRIRVTHEHLLRAFGTFVLLLLLDPLFYALGFRNATQEVASPKVIVVQRNPPAQAVAAAPAVQQVGSQTAEDRRDDKATRRLPGPCRAEQQLPAPRASSSTRAAGR